MDQQFYTQSKETTALRNILEGLRAMHNIREAIRRRKSEIAKQAAVMSLFNHQEKIVKWCKRRLLKQLAKNGTYILSIYWDSPTNTLAAPKIIGNFTNPPWKVI